MLPHQRNVVIVLEPEYEAAKILSRKNGKSGLMYLVKWKGHQDRQPTWEPINNLAKSMNLVRQFERNMMECFIDADDEDGNVVQRVEKRPQKKKAIFKQHLVFPTARSLKTESKNQPEKTTAKKVTRRRRKRQTKKPKGTKKQTGQDFCVLISNQASSPSQNRKEIELQEEVPMKKPEEEQQNYPQYLFQSEENRPSSKAENSIYPPSLNLTQLQHEEDERLTLQNLNPSVFPMKPKPKKLLRIQNPISQLKIVKGNDPALRNPNLRILQIINSENRWLAEVSLSGTSLGFIQVQDLQKKNCSLVLDYLYEHMK